MLHGIEHDLCAYDRIGGRDHDTAAGATMVWAR
jgi:hypothetical protein